MSDASLWPGPVACGDESQCRDAKYKRLEAGTFELPDVANNQQGVELDDFQLTRLLGGLDLKTGRRRRRYRRVG